MKTLLEVYCAEHPCSPQQFRRRVLFATLHLHALPVAWLFLLLNRDHFAADFDLIDAVSHASTMNRVRGEIDEHRYHPFNTGILRRVFAIRLSTHRLKQLARRYLPERASRAPFNTHDKNTHDKGASVA